EVGHDLGSLFVGSNLLIGGGHVAVGRDAGAITVLGNVDQFHSTPQFPGDGALAATAAAFDPPTSFLGDFSIGRDLRVLTVIGDLNLGRSRLNVGRDLKLLQVQGDLNSLDGFIEVTRHLYSLQVAGDWTGPVLLGPF